MPRKKASKRKQCPLCGLINRCRANCVSAVSQSSEVSTESVVDVDRSKKRPRIEENVVEAEENVGEELMDVGIQGDVTEEIIDDRAVGTQGDVAEELIDDRAVGIQGDVAEELIDDRAVEIQGDVAEELIDNGSVGIQGNIAENLLGDGPEEIDENIERNIVEELIHIEDRAEVIDEVPIGNDDDIDINVVHGNLDFIECSFCHRIGSVSVELDLNLLGDNFVSRRIIGDYHNLSPECEVCNNCKIYLSRNVVNFKGAWTSFIYSCLTNERFQPYAPFVLKYLPRGIRDMWRHLDLTHEMRLLLESESSMVDITQSRIHFEEEIQSGNGLRLVQAIDNTAFPNVRCPLGCFMFINDKFRYTCLSSFLTPFESFPHFTCDVKKTVGVRPDFPSAWSDDIFHCNPSVVIQDSQIFVVSCYSHCDLSVPVVHVARNPSLDTFKVWNTTRSDLMAPVHVSTNMVRKGGKGRYNKSYAVLKQRTDSLGSSTFKLTEHIDYHNDLTPGDYERYIIPAFGRQELRPNYERYQFYADLLEQCLSLNITNVKSKLHTYSKSGNYVLASDAANLAVAYNSAKKVDEVVKNCSLTVTSREEERHRSFEFVGRADNMQKELSIMLSLINIFRFNSILYNKLALKSRDDDCHASIRDLFSCVSKEKTKRSVAQKVGLAINICTHLFGIDDVVNVNDDHDKIVAYFVSLLTNVNFNVVVNEDILHVFEGNMSDVVCIYSDIEGNLPNRSEDGHYELLLKGKTVNNKQYLNFKYGPEFNWLLAEREGIRVAVVEDCQYYLYVNRNSIEGSVAGIGFSYDGVQHVMSCFNHDRFYLIKEFSHTAFICPEDGCRKKIRWRCSYMFNSDEQCLVGLCHQHARVHLTKGDQVKVFRLARNDNVDDEEERDEVEGDEEVLLTGYNDEDIIPGDEPIPLFTSDDVTGPPSYITSSSGTSGHFLLVNDLRVRPRVSYARKSPVKHQHLLHSLFSKSDGKINTLLFPEAQLFPSIFYEKTASSYLGSLPSAMYTEYGNSKLKLASFTDHSYIRLKDYSLPTSRDMCYISFNFDAVVNRFYDGNNNRQIARLGLETLNRSYFEMPSKDSTNVEYFKSTRETTKLTRMMAAHGTWDYFITLTSSDSTTPGLRVLTKAVRDHFNILDHDDSDSFTNYMLNIGSIMLQAWHRFVTLLFEYMAMNRETNMFGGRVKTYWYRYEYQSSGAVGNRPHVHGGVTLEEELSYTERLKHVSCRSMDLVGRHLTHQQSLDFKISVDLVEWEITNHGADFVRLVDLDEVVNVHNCLSGSSRCKKTLADGTSMCRVPRYPPSFTGSYIAFSDVVYSPSVIEHLVELGLAFHDIDDLGLPKELMPVRCEYATSNTGYVRIPTNGLIFVLCQSSTNVQVTDSTFVIRYVCKYCTGLDEKRTATFDQKEEELIEVNVRQLYNVKISSCAINEKKILQREKIGEPLAKEITITEMQWFMFKLPYVVNNTEDVHVKLQCLEDRSFSLKLHSHSFATIINNNDTLKTVQGRLLLPEENKFTLEQVLTVREIIQSKCMPDRIQMFSVRPPEVKQVNSVIKYLKWFSFKERTKSFVVLPGSPFVDCLGYVVKFRLIYLKEITAFFRNLNLHGQGNAETLNILINLVTELDRHPNHYSDFFKSYVDCSSIKLVTVVYETVPPTSGTAFLIFLLYRFAKFLCERQLFSGETLLHAFHLGGLVGNPERGTEEEYKFLFKKYILKELTFLPIRKQRYDKYFNLASNILKQFLLGNDVIFSPPLVTELAIQEATKGRLENLEEDRLSALLDVIYSSEIPNLPEREQMMQVSDAPLDYVPAIVQVQGQSDDSVLEQNALLEILICKIRALDNPHFSNVKSIVIAGSPGCGKTYVMLNSVAFCIARRVSCGIISLTSERARAVGGTHIHVMFALDIKTESESVFQVVQQSCGRLLKCPEKFAILKRTRVFFFEELGLISSHMLSCIDGILKFVKEDERRAFGGCLMIASGDHCQLTPIEGTHVWTHSMFITSIDVFMLKHCVRSRLDRDLQDVISLVRKPKLSRRDVANVCSIINRRCRTQCVATWDEVPDDAIRIVGKKSAASECIERYLANKRADPTVHLQDHTSTDTIALRGSDEWQEAPLQAVKELNGRVLEIENVTIIRGSVMLLTYNNNVATRNLPVFSQGQRVVIITLPDLNLPIENQRVVVKLVPYGARVRSLDDVLENWPCISLRRKHSHSIAFGRLFGTSARRCQWPLRYYICSTIHRTIGDTCDLLATQMSKSGSFSVWEKEMFLVLVSRVRSLDDIIFVGSIAGNIEAIRKLLSSSKPLRVALDNKMLKLDISNDEREPIMLPVCDINFKRNIIPFGTVGFAVMIVSLPFPSEYSITDCRNIREYMSLVNGTTSPPNGLHKRPWLLCAYACNFQVDEDVDSNASINKRRDFQDDWNYNVAVKNNEVRRDVTWKEALNEGVVLTKNLNAALIANRKILFFVCME